MKDRKSRRRFAKLMSLTLSASLMLGNVVFAYAGVENPNTPLSDDPNLTIQQEQNGAIIEDALNEGQATAGEVDISTFPSSSFNVSVNPTSISINPVSDPNAEIAKQMRVTSINLVSGDGTVLLSYNSSNSGNKLSLNQLSASLNDITSKEISRESVSNISATVKVTTSTGDLTASSNADGKHYTGAQVVKQVATVSWNDEGSTSKNAISINTPGLSVTATPSEKTLNFATGTPSENILEALSANKISANVTRDWDTSSILTNDKLTVTTTSPWTTSDNKTYTCNVKVNVNGTVEQDGVFYDGTVSDVPVIVDVTYTSSKDDITAKTVTAALKDSSISINVDKKELPSIKVANIESLSVDNVGVASTNLTDNNWEFKLSANGLDTAQVNATVSADLLVKATASNNDYTGSATVKNVAMIKVVSDNGTPKDPEKITNVNGVLKDKNISANINDINKTGKMDISINKLSSLSVNGKAVPSANMTDKNWKLELSTNKAPASISVGDKLSANLLVTATSTNTAYTGNGTIVNAATITVISGNNKPGEDTTKHILAVSPKEVNWDGDTITVSSATAKECTLYRADKAIISDSDLAGLTTVSANCKFVSGNATYKTNWEDAGKYIAAVTGEKDTFSVSNCYVGKKVAVKDVKVNKTDFKITMKDGKAVEEIGKITVGNVNGKTDPKVSIDDFNFEWDIPGNAKVNDAVKIKFTAKATNKYYTGSCSVTVGKVIKVTTTPVIKKSNTMKVSKTALTFKVGDKKAQTIKVTKAQGKITYTIDKKGKKVIKVTANKANTSLKVTPKTKKAAGVATITIKAAGNSAYNAATKKITVTVMPKQKPTAKVKSVKVVSKKAKTAKVTWKAIKNDKKVNGYQIQYATSKKGLSKGKLITVQGAKKATYTIKKLKKGKKIFVRVRAVNTKNGASNPSKKWSAVKSCKVK